MERGDETYVGVGQMPLSFSVVINVFFIMPITITQLWEMSNTFGENLSVPLNPAHSLAFLIEFVNRLGVTGGGKLRFSYRFEARMEICHWHCGRLVFLLEFNDTGKFVGFLVFQQLPRLVTVVGAECTG